MSGETKAMKIIKPGAEPSNEAPAEYFTGGGTRHTASERRKSFLPDLRVGGIQPGTGSAWHTHSKGQLLIVTDGSGLIQEWGKPVRRIVTGDVIWTPPGVKHWHGASPESAMTHTACQEMHDGKNVDWMEKVTDQEYKSAPQ